ncbi:MAG: hypothetical protein CMK83_26325 [Pseudomonadales bacterium]|jgi:hypothetical protein|nr:hypothetical protein [Pseudomonadales bacterium]|tara:strand:- start:212 stop:451 length:240 start_codon:yes stop_codon:yes gene_type:complete
MKIEERITAGLVLGTLGVAIYFLFQFFLALKVFPKFQNVDMFIEFKYGLTFGLILFLLGAFLGFERLEKIIDFLLRKGK